MSKRSFIFLILVIFLLSCESIIATMIVFQTAEQALLSDYTAQLFPDLSNCS